MAQMRAEGTEHGSQSESKQSDSCEAAWTSLKGQAAEDPRREPGVNNEDKPAEDCGSCKAAGPGHNPPPFPDMDGEGTSPHSKPGNNDVECGFELGEPGESPAQGSLASSTDSAQEGSRVLKAEQRETENVCSSAPRCCTKPAEKAEHAARRWVGVEEGEPLSRMDSEDSFCSTLMDIESTASSGRSTPAMLNGHSGGAAAVAGSGPAVSKSLSYTCCWDDCQLLFSSSPDLAEHIRAMHVDGQRGGLSVTQVFVCLWKNCKVYNTPSTSQSWLQRHMLTHSGDKPFKCVVGGCNATFASQGGLARHVPTHFSSQGSSKTSSQGKVKEESPSKAGLIKRRKLRNKYRRSLPRPHDFFDAQTMEAIRHRAICLNLATHIESQGNGHSVVFHSTVIARRKEDSGKVKVLLHWAPEDILPDVWVNESDRLQLKTKVVHLSKLPTDTAVLLAPNIYRMFF
ncbi:zinc finger protein aebp2-like isoform X1 [Poecilia latipinna]|uniref:zinc finger protein aebp2-like isoform X1 n=1 Tax=Poecilia latipinna TaxID=48699 RepID=UPI00072E65C8|nr:PREDICTED: zinc finger protein aebp2-like isoform X1 [Poecilia latipinna]